MFYSIIIIVLINFLIVINADDTPCSDIIITLKNGSNLTGIDSKSILTQKPYCGYLGIPYAEVPVRFQNPKAHKGWDDVKQATMTGNRCLQRTQHQDDTNDDTIAITGSEDCLFLNIYTPQHPNEINSLKAVKAVIVFIHGGAFNIGTGAPTTYSPDYLIGHDVIVITFNYRLDVLGFLDLGLDECPGNVGMKDQVMALKWVKENIESFGGDPNNVTIFGESSGSTSVNLHMMSPLSKGLFQKCIMASGNAINATLNEDEAVEVVQELKTVLGLEESVNEDFLKELKNPNLTDNELFKASKKVVENLYKKHRGKSYPVFFIPSVEKIKENSFLPENPSILATYAEPVPVMAGLNDKEFLLQFPIIEKNVPFEEILSLINDDLAKLVEENLSDWNLSKESLNHVAEEVKEFYFNNEAVDENSYLKIIDLYSDLCYVRTIYKSIQSSLKFNKSVYVYRFSYNGNFNLGKIITSRFKLGQWKIAEDLTKYTTHMDELGYLFYPSRSPKIDFNSKSEADVEVIDIMCKFWTNFAKTGNPNGQDKTNSIIWSGAVDNSRDHHLVIGNDISESEEKIFADTMEFWEQLEKKYSDVNKKNYESTRGCSNTKFSTRCLPS